MDEKNSQETDIPALNDDRGIVRLSARIWGGVCADPKRVVRWLVYACGALVLLDLLFLHGKFDKHAHYAWENGIGFYAVYGFVSCVLLVLISKHLLRPAVKRDEDYYD